MGKKITINLRTDDEAEMKRKIADLRGSKDTMYSGRSESEIAKILIAKPLSEVHEELASSGSLGIPEEKL